MKTEITQVEAAHDPSVHWATGSGRTAGQPSPLILNTGDELRPPGPHRSRRRHRQSIDLAQPRNGTGQPNGQLATAYGESVGASLHISTGVNMGPFGSVAYWLRQSLNLISGNLDRGGGPLLMPEGAFDVLRPDRHPGPRRIPTTDLTDLDQPRLTPKRSGAPQV